MGELGTEEIDRQGHVSADDGGLDFRGMEGWETGLCTHVNGFVVHDYSLETANEWGGWLWMALLEMGN